MCRHYRPTRSPATLAIIAVICSLSAATNPARADDDDRWPGLRSELFAQRAINEDAPGLVLDAPIRADDAAIVPITVHIRASMGEIKSLKLIVDKNPAPLAATFTFGPAIGSGERMIATRLRFDLYSNLRAVVETADGQLFMTTKFVKAAGGCSAPALKDADEALAALGRMQVKSLGAAEADPALRMGQVMVRHPNYNGMQMNPETGLFIPAKYVTDMEVTRGADRVFKLESSISISADPNLRFTFASAPDTQLSVTTKDSDGKTFTGQSAPSGS